MVTSRDVARAAGVSQATVSRVMSAPSSVSDDTRARVLTAMESVGYVPNHAARAMRTGHSRTVGIVVADLENPFYPQMLDALSSAFARDDYRVIVWVATTTGNDAALEAIRQGSVDGVVFTTATEESSELRSALQRRSPLVLVNRPLPQFDCDQVSSDNEAGAIVVAEYLIEHGRTSAGFIGGTPRATTSRARLAGFTSRLPVDPALVVEGEYTYADGYRGMTRLLDSGRPLDAVFCANDLLAFGAMDAARTAGVRIPADLWVIGYDDIPMASWDAYDLTTIRQDVASTADVAARLLIERIEGAAHPSVTTQFAPELIVRGSTANA